MLLPRNMALPALNFVQPHLLNNTAFLQLDPTMPPMDTAPTVPPSPVASADSVPPALRLSLMAPRLLARSRPSMVCLQGVLIPIPRALGLLPHPNRMVRRLRVLGVCLIRTDLLVHEASLRSMEFLPPELLI